MVDASHKASQCPNFTFQNISPIQSSTSQSKASSLKNPGKVDKKSRKSVALQPPTLSTAYQMPFILKGTKLEKIE
eukprot:1278329-Amorphochlora_amoeboformis.AAC.2